MRPALRIEVGGATSYRSPFNVNLLAGNEAGKQFSLEFFGTSGDTNARCSDGVRRSLANPLQNHCNIVCVACFRRKGFKRGGQLRVQRFRPRRPTQVASARTFGNNTTFALLRDKAEKRVHLTGSGYQCRYCFGRNFHWLLHRLVAVVVAALVDVGAAVYLRRPPSERSGIEPNTVRPDAEVRRRVVLAAA